jgi:hypothetical protein
MALRNAGLMQNSLRGCLFHDSPPQKVQERLAISPARLLRIASHLREAPQPCTEWPVSTTSSGFPLRAAATSRFAAVRPAT